MRNTFRIPRANWLLLLFSLLSAIGLAANENAGALSHDSLFAPNKTFPYFEDCGVLEQTPRGEFSITSAAMLAQCSMLAYVDDHEFIAEELCKIGFNYIRFFDTDGTHAFLAEDHENIVIVFRGTESGDKIDYRTNSKFHHSKFTEFGRTHTGFLKALECVSEELLSELEVRQQGEVEKKVWLTGHSLGAALATLFGIQNSDTVHAIYAIGSPRLVNKSLAKKWHEELPLFRIVNNNDLVPRLPPPLFYHHIGPTYFITADYSLLVDPPKTKIWKDRLKGHGQFNKELVGTHWLQRDFKTIPSDYFVDHSPRLYAEHLIHLSSM